MAEDQRLTSDGFSKRLLEVEAKLTSLHEMVESPNGTIRIERVILDIIGCLEELTEWAKETQDRFAVR